MSSLANFALGATIVAGIITVLLHFIPNEDTKKTHK